MPLLKVDLTSQSYKRDPYPTLAGLIEQGPLIRTRFPIIGTLWMATHHESVNEMLRDRQTFVREPRSAGMPQGSNRPWWLPRSMLPMVDVMINRDEPDHRRLRDLVEQAFLRRSVEKLRPHFEAIANQMLDELEEKARGDGRPVDLVSGLARPFPLAVICELLGLPPEDRPKFVKQAESFAKGFSVLNLIRMLGGITKTTRTIREEIVRCRSSPRPGLISELIAARNEDGRLTEDEMVAMVVLLLMAGHITTVHLIGTGIATLLEHPDQLQALRTDWSLAESTVDELLRYVSPVQLTKPMMPARDLEWHGQRLKRGEKVIALLAAANVDPSKFAFPDRFDLRRDPNPHVAFGAGIHVCLGAKLARIEAEVALQQLLTRFPNLELDVPYNAIPWSKHPGTRGLSTLPVKLG